MIFLLLLLLSLVSGQKGGAKGAMRGRGKVQSAFESLNVLKLLTSALPLHFILISLQVLFQGGGRGRGGGIRGRGTGGDVSCPQLLFPFRNIEFVK